MVAQYISRRPSLNRSRTSPSLHRDTAKAFLSACYPLSPPSTPTKPPAPPRRWAPTPGAPLKGRRLVTLAVQDEGKRRWVVDLQTGAKFWAVEMPAARRRLSYDTPTTVVSAPSTPSPARSQRQQETPPRSP